MTMGLVNAARQLEEYGRGPDKSLAHISPDESAVLDYMQGGRRVNPVTGLPEYGAFGKILKAVARVGAAVGGFMYGGPAGAAAASAAATKLTGGSWKQSLTSGAISGLTAGLGNYFQGKELLSSGLANSSIGASGLAGSAGTAAAGSSGWSSLGPGVLSQSTTAPTLLSQAGLQATKEFLKTPAGLSLALGAASAPTGKKSSGAPPNMPTMPTYDPTNIPNWMKPLAVLYNPRAIKQPEQQTPYQTIPIEGQFQGFAGGGKAGPRLMSPSQWMYLNAKGGGRVSGPGSGKSDDIPALLSNGEHVIDAATVSDLGDGDNDAGHKKIEQLKKHIRKKAGRKNPHKPTPRQGGIGQLMKMAS